MKIYLFKGKEAQRYSKPAQSFQVALRMSKTAILILNSIFQDNLLNNNPFVFQYGIVLDAGSSRTTVYIYEWPAEKENNTGVVSQTFKCNVKGKGKMGISEEMYDQTIKGKRVALAVPWV